MSKQGELYRKQLEKHIATYATPGQMKKVIKEVMAEVKKDIKNGTFKKKVERWAKRQREDE